MPDFNLDIPASSNPKCLRLWPSGSCCTHGIHGRLMGGACACMYLLQAVFFCLRMKKLSIPSAGIQSAPNHKYQTQDKVQP